jgi:hypothetical protein
MPRSYNPNAFAQSLDPLHRQFVQSVDQTLNGGVDMGTPTGNAPDSAGVNAGVYTKFKQGNSSGVLIRIAAQGVTDTGADYEWGAVSTGIVINHGLLRKPIGFKIVDMDKPVQVYRTAPPDKQQITLAPTDNTASVTIYVF